MRSFRQCPGRGYYLIYRSVAEIEIIEDKQHLRRGSKLAIHSILKLYHLNVSLNLIYIPQSRKNSNNKNNRIPGLIKSSKLFKISYRSNGGKAN